MFKQSGGVRDWMFQSWWSVEGLDREVVALLTVWAQPALQVARSYWRRALTGQLTGQFKTVTIVSQLSQKNKAFSVLGHKLRGIPFIVTACLMGTLPIVLFQPLN